MDLTIDQLFTRDSLLTLQGGVTLSEERSSWTWVVAVLNGFLIAFTALGLNKTSEKVFGGKQTPAPQPAPATAPVPGGPGVGGPMDAERADRPAPAPSRATRPAGFTRGWL